VALLPVDHELIRVLADYDQRTMTRQLSVIVRDEYARIYGDAALDKKLRELAS
jgi:hypothetical protein